MSNRAAHWKKIRARILERDGWRCTTCSKAGAMEVHHVRHVRHGGDDSDDNLVSLCAACHLEVHRRPQTDAQREWRAFVEELVC